MQASDGKARDAGPRHEKHANQMQKLLEERAKAIEDLQKREEELRVSRDKVHTCKKIAQEWNWDYVRMSFMVS